MHRLDLGRGVTFEINPAERYVATVFADGHRMGATREDTPHNRAIAAEQGYRGPGAVWRSLVTHEWLHSALSHLLFRRWSRVLRHECGAEHHTHRERTQEEGLVMAGELWMQTGRVDQVLWPHLPVLCRLGLTPLPNAA
jgi:hypothetical protein